MNIKISIPPPLENGISVVNEIPEGNALKLIGLNGTGKTLSAKLICTLTAHPVWDFQEQIETLSRYLPAFNVNIDIDHSTNFTVLCDVSKWKYDDVTKTVLSETVGVVTKNGVESNISELRQYLSCHLIKGNEDIRTQIDFIAKSLVSQIKGYFRSKAMDLQNFNEYISWLSGIMSHEYDLENLSEIKDSIDTENEKSIVIGESDVVHFNKLFATLENSRLDFVERLPSFSKFSGIIKKEQSDCQYELKQLNEKIEWLQENYLSTAELMKEYSRLEKKLNEISIELNSEEPPMNIADFSSPECLDHRQVELTLERINLIEKEDRLKSQRFRTYFIDNAERSIGAGLEKYNLPEDKTILLYGDTFETDWTVWEFRARARLTHMKGEEELHDSPSLSEVKYRLEEISKEEETLRSQAEFLKKREKMLERYNSAQESLNELADISDDDLSLSELLQKKENLELVLSKYQIAKEKLIKTSVKAVKFWDKISKKEEIHLSIFINMIESFSYHYDRLGRLERRFSETKGKYFSRIEDCLEGQDDILPSLLLNAIEKKDIEYIEKSHNAFGKLIDKSRLDYVERKAQEAIDHILKQGRRQGGDSHNEYCTIVNQHIGQKLKELLNKAPFKKYMFGGTSVEEIDVLNGKIYLDADGERVARFIDDYSSGEKAFAYAFSTILNMSTIDASADKREVILFLDEFGALLSLDRMEFLVGELNRFQREENWPSKYVLIFPYKGEVEEEQIAEKGYTFIPVQEELI